MREERHPRPIPILLAVAHALAIGALPAAAQSGSEAVVCVGGETRTLQTNPIRRVYVEDMEVVYRIGVDIGQRDRIEGTLSSELAYPEVWCAWSDPGDDHAVIISYTGVIRQDLTIDPEDPRFQAFSVGFGPDFDAAEIHATTIDQRFSSRYDGSGYEVLLREMWGVAEGVVAGGDDRGFSPPEGPICTGRASSEGCWMEISNQPGCYLWNPFPQDDETVRWSGDCSEGFAEGRGETTWYENDDVAGTDAGRLQAGRPEGFTVLTYPGSRSEGRYVDGERHGTWTIHYEGDEANMVREVGPYVDGERHGTWTAFFEGRDNNMVRTVGAYVNGEVRGTWTAFYEGRDDNMVREAGPFVNRERNGTWTIHYEGRGDSLARVVGSYVNGEIHGTWIWYDGSDNVVETQRWENGRRVGGSESVLEAATAATMPPLQFTSPAARSPPGACAVTPRHQRAVIEVALNGGGRATTSIL